MKRKKIKFMLFIFIGLLLLGAIFSGFYKLVYKADINSAALNFYVSPSGNDLNIGTIDQPFATLEKARDTLRIIKNNSPNSFPGANVYFRNGVYEVNQTINFDQNDSGTINAPIFYKNYPNEKPIIRDSKTITGWQLKPGSTTIYQVDLANQGFGGKKISQIYNNGEKQILAQTPNYTAPDFSQEDPYMGNWFYVSVNNSDGTERLFFEYNTPDINQTVVDNINSFTGTNNSPEVLIFPDINNYMSTIVQIDSIDSINHHINLNLDGIDIYNFYQRNRYILKNYSAALDAQKEWYQDLENNLLYYIPPNPIDSNTNITASTYSGDTFYLNGTSFLNFRGIDFEQSGGKIFNLLDSHDITINNCVLANNNDVAINIVSETLSTTADQTVSKDIENIIPLNITIDHNHIYNTGSAGINIGIDAGYTKKLVSSNILISNNKIHDVGQKAIAIWGADGQPVWGAAVSFAKFNPYSLSRNATGVNVSHNEIFNTPWNGIIGAGNDNIIEYNRVYDTMQIVQDGGAIYLGTRDWRNRGNIIRNNFISDTYGYGLYREWDLGPSSKWILNKNAHGIYLDDYTSGTLVENNIIVNSSSSAINNHMGRDNIVRNNTIFQNNSFGGDGLFFYLNDYNLEKNDTYFNYLWFSFNNMEADGYNKAKYYDKYNKNHELDNIPSRESIDLAQSTISLMTNNTVTNNIIDYSNAAPIDYYESNGVPYKYNNSLSNAQNIDNNIFSGGERAFGVDNIKESVIVEGLSDWQAKGFDLNSIFIDPLYVDTTNNNYSLKDDSPALIKGFQQIDQNEIGISKIDNPPGFLTQRTIFFQSPVLLSGQTTNPLLTEIRLNNEATNFNRTTGQWNQEINLVQGKNQFSVLGVDIAGNQSDPVSIDLTKRKMADANGDNNIDLIDFGYIMANWGIPPNYLADFNADGKTDLLDFGYLMANWGK